MIDYTKALSKSSTWTTEKLLAGSSPVDYVTRIATPFNVVAVSLALAGLYFIVIRFTAGLGAVTTGSQDIPWGLFLSWGLFSGVPLSSTGFIVGSAVFLFGVKEFRPVVKNAVLIGFLGYFFAVLFLLIDLGRPWRLPYPMVVSYGTASVLFLVAWHVALYLTCQFLEVLPSIPHWGGWRRLERWATNLTIVLTIFGVILSTLHQSALGAMYLIAPTKLHPLWYSPYLPVLFLISAIAAGLCLMIVVGYLTRRFLGGHASRSYMDNVDGISFGLAKAAAFVLITYFGLKIVALSHGNSWGLLATPFGSLYLGELLLSTLVPCALLVIGLKRNSLGLIIFGAVCALGGIVLYRFNVSMVALNWQIPNRVFSELPEVMIVIGVVAAQVLLYKWIVSRMPILEEDTG